MDLGGVFDEVDTMIVIAGNEGGIGKYLCETYNAMGYKIASFSHKEVDITSLSSIDAWIERTPLDGGISLINCVGYSNSSLLSRSDPVEWRSVIEVNLIGTYNLLHRLLPVMRRNSFGRIILISSVVAQKGTRGTSAYAASKSALWGLSKAVAVENADKDININCINLGYTDVGMISKVPLSLQQTLLEDIPMKRFCSREEVFNAVEYFRGTSYSTGSTLDLNGGLV